MENKLIKNKNFMLTFLGALVSNIGAILYSFAVSFYILKITNNNSIIQGTYLLVTGIVSVIVTLFGGVIADRFNKAKIMYICDYIKGAILASTTIIMIFNNSSEFTVVLLFIAGITGSIVSSLFSPASSALLPLIVEENQLQKANSYFSLLQSVQSIVGILLAGILYSVLPITILFFIVSGCYIISAISEMFIRYDYIKNENKLSVKTTFSEIGEGFTYIFNNKAIFNLILCILFINFFFNPIFSNFLPYFISSKVSNSDYLFNDFMNPEMWDSVFNLLSGIGMIVGSLIIGVIHYKKASNPSKISLSFLSLVMISFAIFYYIFGIRNDSINPLLIILSIGSLIQGLLLPIINVPISTALQLKTDKNMLGKVNAATNVGSMGLTPLSSFLAGIIISGASEFALLLICGIGFLITTIFFLSNKKISEL